MCVFVIFKWHHNTAINSAQTYFDTVLLLIEEVYSSDMLEYRVQVIIYDIVRDHWGEAWSLQENEQRRGVGGGVGGGGGGDAEVGVVVGAESR